MLKRRILLGSLVAGAFLLPVAAQAGVQGACVNCHTMHDSQNGVAVNTTITGQNDYLLKSGGCVGCHANTEENDSTGRGDGTIMAPQVDGNATGYVNNAGYFNAALNDNTHHNVAGLHSVDADMDAAATTAPGGTMLLDDGTGNPELTCQGCHGGQGHHAASGDYRMLIGNTSTNNGQADYGAVAYAVGVASGTRNEINYVAADMNTFCGSCHGDFHTPANQAGVVAGTWMRHPTDIAVVNNTDQPSIVAGYDTTNDIDQAVVGSTNVVMCLSCHVAHGNANADMLAFTYDNATNVAGGTAPTASNGCETCHDYGSGM